VEYPALLSTVDWVGFVGFILRLKAQVFSSNLYNLTVLKQAETVTENVSRIAFPAFSLDRGEGCEIHENAYWELQTYLGLRENLAVNEGARSELYPRVESGADTTWPRPSRIRP